MEKEQTKEARLLWWKELLEQIKDAIEEVKNQTKLEEKDIHITVSKDTHEEIVRTIMWPALDAIWELTWSNNTEIIWLNKLFWCNYHVSPFITADSHIWVVVWVFNYAQMLGQWNTFTDNWRKYDLNDLLNNYRIIIL